MKTHRQYEKILLVGGGSVRWTPWAVCSMAVSESMRDCELTLYDIDAERLESTAELSRRMLARAYPEAGLTIRTSTSLDECLGGQQVVIYQVCVGGLQTELTLMDVLRDKHGIENTIFTTGPASPVYVAIQAPPLLALVEKMQQLCPEAILINQSNPLPALHRLVERTSNVEVFSYCFGSRNSLRGIADTFQIDRARVKMEMTGADHVGVATQILIDGEDRYAEFIDTLAREGYVDQAEWGRVTPPADLARQWGYYFNVTHATDMFREAYTHDIIDSRITGDCLGHITYRENFDEMVCQYADGRDSEFAPPGEIDDSFVWLECLAGSYDKGNLHWVNLTNNGLAREMPDWAVLELECYIDERGIRPLRPAVAMPEFVAEMNRHHLASLELAVTACLQRDRRKLVEAIAMTPHLDDPRDAAKVYDNCKTAMGDLLPF